MSDRHLISASEWTGEPDRDHVYHHSDLTDADRSRRFGAATLDMAGDLVAGSSCDVTFRFTAGDMELPGHAGLRIAWRWPFDWDAPQTRSPAAPNHLVVTTPDTCRLAVAFERAGGMNPWQHHIDLRVTDGVLHPSDVVDIHLRNWQCPTFATVDGYFIVVVSPGGDDEWHRLVDPPRFQIEAGVADRLIAIAPADGVIGEPATVRIRAVDAWENPVAIDAPQVTGDGVDIGVPVLCEEHPVWEVPVQWHSASRVHRLVARAGQLTTTTNPTRVFRDCPASRIFWGDLHGGQSEIGCGAGTLDHHYTYARDVAGLQFTSQQANDHYITAALWQHVREVTPRYNSATFLSLLGCEWSPFTPDGGDRNVIYLKDEAQLHRSDRFFTETNPDLTPDMRRAPEFLQLFSRKDVLLNLHVGGRPTNLAFHAPEIEPLFEVHSTHATSEWFLFDALSRGYKVGVTGGTDGVMGRPGADGPGRRVCRNVHNGLTAVTATSLTQTAVADALRARQCYATTGARILLDVEVEGVSMGGSATAEESVHVTVTVEGTAPIERLDLFRGIELISSEQVAAADPARLRLLWGGARERGTAGAQRKFWVGSLQAEGVSITDVQSVGLQCPQDEITMEDGVVRFSTVTAGNDMGFTFSVEAPGAPNGMASTDAASGPDAVAVTGGFLHVETEPASLDCSVAQARVATVIADGGGLARRLELGLAPDDRAPLSATVNFVDDTPLSGEHPYWIRLTQIDRQRAWSSPVYITV